MERHRGKKTDDKGRRISEADIKKDYDSTIQKMKEEARHRDRLMKAGDRIKQ